MTNAQSKNINEEINNIINLDGAKCSGCDEYLYEDEVGERCEKCEKELDDDEEEQCERCGEYHCEDDEEFGDRVLWVSNTDGKNLCRKCCREEDETEDKETQICEECGEECPYPAVIKVVDGPSHSVFFCRPCLKVKKDCPTCEKPTTNDELILCDGVCRKCECREMNTRCRRCKYYYDELNDDGICEACVYLVELDEIYGGK